jgi:hypothetical protein
MLRKVRMFMVERIYGVGVDVEDEEGAVREPWLL